MVGCAVLMPHAPILVPAIGGARGEAAAASGRALRAAAATVLRDSPETLVVISPHSPRRAGAFGLWADDCLGGSFAQFGAPQVQVSLPNDQRLANALAAEAEARSGAIWRIHDQLLDHGALVPLWFLVEAGWTGPTVILSLSASDDAAGRIRLGEAIAAVANELPRRIAIIASGDMSHRLTANAPCGFHPQARQFDETFVHLVRAGHYREIQNIDPDLRELAAEDAVDSTLIAAAAGGWRSAGHRLLNYEGPFGVGYGVAILFTETPKSSQARSVLAPTAKRDGEVLPEIARQSVTAALDDRSAVAPAAVGEYLSSPRGVFVTLRRRNGQLRGCVGRIEPASADLVAETWRNARLAALQDNRFPLVTAEELADLRFEVSVLHTIETVTSVAELDPRRYGVIASTGDGRRGLLLPGIAAIKTGTEQLRLARQKGGIDSAEPVAMQRFQVDHFEEPD